MRVSADKISAADVVRLKLDEYPVWAIPYEAADTCAHRAADGLVAFCGAPIEGRTHSLTGAGLNVAGQAHAPCTPCPLCEGRFEDVLTGRAVGVGRPLAGVKLEGDRASRLAAASAAIAAFQAGKVEPITLGVGAREVLALGRALLDRAILAPVSTSDGRPLEGGPFVAVPLELLARLGGPRVCPRCGARPELERADLPLVACLGCGWKRATEEDERVARLELEALGQAITVKADRMEGELEPGRTQTAIELAHDAVEFVRAALDYLKGCAEMKGGSR
jgi:hypothetical protein